VIEVKKETKIGMKKNSKKFSKFHRNWSLKTWL